MNRCWRLPLLLLPLLLLRLLLLLLLQKCLHELLEQERSPSTENHYLYDTLNKIKNDKMALKVNQSRNLNCSNLSAGWRGIGWSACARGAAVVVGWRMCACVCVYTCRRVLRKAVGWLTLCA